ncbi:hypothetical protein WA026_004215 [Henosepilachna vigintioctopunctata]|uniref:Uncharacterized protein n=1 Tax=Henosepilachna vigintioctopunctata TaxID=420089 RepID=A0AAW1UFQ2_9CUCU
MAIILNGALHGELAVSYLYTRLKFQWNSKDYGLFTGILFSVDILGTIAAVTIFTKCLGFDDSFLGIVGLTGSVVGNMVYAFAPNGFIFYLGIFCDFFRIATYVATRSIMAKLVPPDELGQSNSVFGVCEAITPVIFGPLYTTIYNYTIQFFPGMYFLVTTAMKILVSSCLYICIYWLRLKKDVKSRHTLAIARTTKTKHWEKVKKKGTNLWIIPTQTMKQKLQ